MTDTAFSGALLWPHHQRTVERLVRRFEHDPRFEALLVGGSLVKGFGREDSDVDIMLIATPDEFRQRQARGDYSYFSEEECDYAGGYVDGKILDLAFLQDVARRGSEPARAAFVGAYPAFSRLPDLERLLQRITAYPDDERPEKMRAFYGHVLIMNWYVGEAEKRGDLYLLRHTSTELALYAGRLFLAHNRILYPYHKWFMRRLQQAPDKPADLTSRLEQLLATPSRETAQALLECVNGFQDWGMDFGDATRYFLENREWNWRELRTPLEDR
ncbi:nucleotidyltransferase domain-containing protein [Deinococcus peraridilitoris]|uniref:Nucleotidyltransferase family protein n=1 Tax=Deinococcus peraridilitoris (strain DSM 19664 / LMG 22246 / CIP 109416 / KR-200) TaxID=937777 RepID=L0A1B3_DEIPD|nr:nucleotidyltransferase domain-containing protein [Deinococcus peraridilitoris]AFZ67678.1 nucleotidyltransferase family protein [Deinococcus peraridilitoris DSM 19664]